jgi:molybdate transport system substrate-binding protein
MNKSSIRRALILCLISVLFSAPLFADEVKIAVAANFTAAMKEIARSFEQSSGHKVLISYGSTGKLYAQILHDAPFEVFLAADQKRPRLLEQQQLAEQRFTYAVGKLALWSSDTERDVSAEALGKNDFRRLALTNPKTAPYGAAAVTVMQRLGLYETLKPKLVQGDNVTQTYQFVTTGSAQMGFVALAQIALDDSGNAWEVPSELYDPIRQDAVLLTKGKENGAAVAFLEYLNSEAAGEIIRRYGYAVESPAIPEG